MTGDDHVAQSLTRHLRILGICWVLYGILRLVTAVWLALFSNTATLMFGALLGRGLFLGSCLFLFGHFVSS